MDEYETLDRPLFGVSTRRERLMNLVIGAVTCVLVCVTILMSFISVDVTGCEFNGNNLFFGICIATVCASLLVLIHWYREGDVDPKFKKLIYFNSVSVCLLCICANCYFFSCEQPRHIENVTTFS